MKGSPCVCHDWALIVIAIMQSIRHWQERSACKCNTPTAAFLWKKNVERKWWTCVRGCTRSWSKPTITGWSWLINPAAMWASFRSYCTLMGPSTGSSPCSDSCFKALRAAWEEKEQQMVEWVGREGRKGREIWVGREWVSPFSCFSNNTYSGKPDASRTLSLHSLLSLASLLSLFI